MRIKKIFCLAVIATLCEFSPLAHAQWSDYKCKSTEYANQHVVKTYQDGSWDLYLTGYTWHSGATFSKKNLNARAYGGGLGKHWTDENGNQDLIYAFTFLDSHKDLEPVVGYAHQWFTRPIDSLSFGAGFTAGFTARADILHYLPIPLLLPVGSIRFNKFSLMTTIVPRRRGAVGLIWGRYEL